MPRLTRTSYTGKQAALSPIRETSTSAALPYASTRKCALCVNFATYAHAPASGEPLVFLCDDHADGMASVLAQRYAVRVAARARAGP